jgi:hypothetical protein
MKAQGTQQLPVLSDMHAYCVAILRPPIYCICAYLQYYDLPWLSLRDALWVDLVAPGGSSHNTSSHSSLHSQPPESGRPAVHDSHVSSTGSDTAPTWQAVMGAAEGGLAQLGHRCVLGCRGRKGSMISMQDNLLLKPSVKEGQRGIPHMLSCIRLRPA